MPYTVFPLHPLVNGECQCSEGAACARPGKHPAIRWGDLEPGTQHFGPAGHAIATGYRSDIFVVDTDGPEADALFRAKCSAEDLNTYTVRTPSGGAHYYFAWPGFPVSNSQSKLLAKVDVRGDGGFVVTPGSPHKSGRPYTVERNVAPKSAPAWVLEWDGLRGRDLGTSGYAPTPVDITSSEGKRRVEMGRKACAELPPSIKGENGSGALWLVALKLIRHYELPLDVAAELVATVYNPRCEPSWTAKEIEHKLVHARDKSDIPCGIFTADGLLAKLANATVPAPERVVVASSRKLADPAHTHKVQVGDPSSTKSAKISFVNVCSLLRSHADWEGVLQHDLFRDRVFAVDPPIELDAEGPGGYSDKDTDRIVAWFGLGGGLLGEDGEPIGGFTVSPDMAFRAAMLVASENAYHPVREWLDALPHVDGSFLEDAARAIFGADGELESAIVKRFLIAAVRRMQKPGTKVDTMLVLAGPQGVGKSTFVRYLFGDEFVSEDIPDLSSKDAVVATIGKWGVEVAELDKIVRSEAETAKAFLSRTKDTYRPPYGRVSVDRFRECVFVGTTNRDDILRDATGSRRFWIVKTDSVNLSWLQENREKLWAAARDLAEKGEPHWLSASEERAREFASRGWEERDPWHNKILEFIAGKERVMAEDVFRGVGGSLEHFGRRELLRVTDTLQRIGCEKGFEGKGLARVRCWLVPESLATVTPIRSTEVNPKDGGSPDQGKAKLFSGLSES